MSSTRMTNMVIKSQITLALHVDDILFMCKNESSIENVIQQIREKYEEVTVHEGVVLFLYRNGL